jgi:hypothetical protein
MILFFENLVLFEVIFSKESKFEADNIFAMCCNIMTFFRAWKPEDSLVRISPNNSTVGVFELTFRVSCGGVNVTKCRYLNYTILPSVTRNPITGSVPPLEAQNDLDRLMIEKGARHCNNETIFRNGIWEGGVWYYDGMNNYQSIAEYTRNTSWYICSDWIAQVYRDGYVLANSKLCHIYSKDKLTSFFV